MMEWDEACTVAGIRAERLNEVDEMIRIYRDGEIWASAWWPEGSYQRQAMQEIIEMRPTRE